MKVLVLSDNVLIGFARDQRLRAAVPILHRLYQSVVKGGGGCRCRKKRGSLGGMLAAVKQAIATDSGLARKLKARTNSQKLVVHVRQGNRVVRKEV